MKDINIKDRMNLWLIGFKGIETRADLAHHLGLSRARVTKVLRRLV